MGVAVGGGVRVGVGVMVGLGVRVGVGVMVGLGVMVGVGAGVGVSPASITFTSRRYDIEPDSLDIRISAQPSPTRESSSDPTMIVA